MSIAFFLTGTMAMLSSYFAPERLQYRLRWLFGAGAFAFIIGIGIVSTAMRQEKSAFIFANEAKAYIGIVEDIPQEKPKTQAYKVYLPDYDKQVVCYVQRDSVGNKYLQPGDELFFYGKIQPFRNMGNPDDFDYERYMYNQGFAGSVYLPREAWQASGEVFSSPEYLALRCRTYIMDFYKSLGLNHMEYSILCGLTLGYKDELTDDIKQGFRTTGTVHVLSTSGLHVMIIYLMISFLLGFIRKGARYYALRPILIILLLWCYAFVTGLSPSVVRASIMLTVFCVSEVARRRNTSLNALYTAAFFILLYNPFSLFNIGFQLSFMSVLSILHLQPKASRIFYIENKYLNELWQMFTLSLVAQLATFPICLYYFGTFPTYFFAANLVIVPLVSLIIYTMGVVVAAKVFSLLIGISLYSLPLSVLQGLVWAMTGVISFFESLPFALISDAKVSSLQLVLIFILILSFLLFFLKKNSKGLIAGLTAALFLLATGIYDNLQEDPNQLIVFNRPGKTEILYDEISINSENIKPYQYLDVEGETILVLSENLFQNQVADEKLAISHLILINDKAHSLYHLSQLFSVRNVILDGSLPSYVRHRLSKECKKLNIPCHDVAENGAYTLNF
ncbi:ComEC/Rec2 family competence protein [Dysgonomonas sp. 511]|uniref:ComEC/Rec2 family competence protein n=1 Tax=Dysgonomonas sp. 511 TaxID=2302930 RepID=UPI0034CEDA32